MNYAGIKAECATQEEWFKRCRRKMRSIERSIRFCESCGLCNDAAQLRALLKVCERELKAPVMTDDEWGEVQRQAKKKMSFTHQFLLPLLYAIIAAAALGLILFFASDYILMGIFAVPMFVMVLTGGLKNGANIGGNN